MAVRFLEDGYQYLDPMSGATTSGSVLSYDDGSRPAPWEDRPGQGLNDAIANEALRWMEVPRPDIYAVRPPVPQVVFPPRFGFVREPVTIDDIFFNDQMWEPRPRMYVWPPVGPAAVPIPMPAPRTARRIYEEDQMWSGTERNAQFTGGVNPML